MAWFAVRVAGRSMEPTLRQGDLLAVRPLRHGEPRVAQIVVARTAEREIVKRVGLVAEDGDVWVEGDNAAASTDSRAHGWLRRDEIAGVVRLRYWPPARARCFIR